IIDEGPEVERVRRIMARLVPPYVNPSALRVHVVDTKEWNAAAMGNGAIWVYRGLLKEMNDDELAIILGHELAHYTHEHSRRGAKKAMWGQLAGLAGMVGTSSMGSGAGRDAATMGTLLSLTAWQSGYSRDFEDQADRVGLRYAHEGGFDVSRGPALWKKFRKKYGEDSAATNFLFGSHSRPSDRIRNIERELALNYRNETK
ncbi:MAG TPA: M48 family metalloprotease, partial [Vicinamibacteria bacterium]